MRGKAIKHGAAGKHKGKSERRETMNSDTKTKAQPQDSEETEAETDKARFEKDYILETGSVLRTKGRHAIHCLTVIGQIEGHSIAPQTQKTTKYEHVIPQLVSIEEDPEVEGLLVILNTVGGDVEAGLALADAEEELRPAALFHPPDDTHHPRRRAAHHPA